MPDHSNRPYLVFCRAGSQSLHPRLIQEDPARNWDCCVSWYAAPGEDKLAEFYTSGGDNKLEGFLEWRRKDPRPWTWRYVLLLDDDVYFEAGDISRYFELCDRHGTWLSQPALRWDTHYNLNVTLANPACIARRVSFVEIMAPCLSAAAVDSLVGTFTDNKSTWGTDWTWAALAEDRAPVHVIDAVRVRHTKLMDKGGGAFYRRLRAMGVDPAAELAAAKARHPAFRGVRTLPSGHVYRRGIPAFAGPAATWLFEHIKFIARLRKQLVRRLYRARAA